MTKKDNNFKGFNPEIYKFFKKLEKNNNKEWFDKNREFYINEIREPIKAFACDMTNYLYSKGLEFGSNPRKSVFRINRDIRFSKNKDPYKNNLGVIFPYTATQNTEKKDQSIGLYVHYERDNSFIAGGLRCPNPAPLKAIRERLLYDWKEFEKIITNKTFKKEYPKILPGESLKKQPRGFPKEHPADKYLKLKDFTVWCEIDHNEFYSRNLMNLLVKKAKVIEPFVKFLLEAVED
ncbi:DUF2461 domain-containing protein [Bacteroidota bacterium]